MGITRRAVVFCAAALIAAAVPGITRAQTVTRAALNGDWTGILSLDNTQPQISMVFQLTDSSFAGKVYDDGKLFGPMESGTLIGNVVHFKVDRFEFTGTISGTRMTVDLVVYNGTVRRFVATKMPGAQKDTSPSMPAPAACVLE